MFMYTMLLIISSSFMVSCWLLSFISYEKPLLNSLLSLKFVKLGIFWLMSTLMYSVSSYMYFSLFFFLTMAAFEGALGLSLLIFIFRTHGNDCFSSFSTLEF